MRKFKKPFKIIMILLFILTACVFLDGGKQVNAKVRLNKKTAYMTKGSTLKLKVKGTKKKAKWKSSNKSVVTVSKKGRLKAKDYGTAVITAKVKGKKLTCKVTVERKTATRARTLRNFVLKKGKYNKTTKGYVYTYKPSYDDQVLIAKITAWKGKYNLEFFYELRPDSPESTRTTVMNIDLITGTSSLKNGRATTHYVYQDDWEDQLLEGSINTDFNGKDAGLVLNQVTEEEENYPNPIFHHYTDPAILKNYMDIYHTQMKIAFKNWNTLFSKNKTLKKAKITMTSIGFTKFK